MTSTKQTGVVVIDVIVVDPLPVVGRRSKKMRSCALVAKQKMVELTLWENVTCTSRNGVSWR